MSTLKVEEDYIASIPLSRRLETKDPVSAQDLSLFYQSLLSTVDEHPIVQARRRRASSSSSQSSFSRTSLTCPSPQPDDEDAWNLIPYNIPWGPDYYAYKSGTLPGPGGKSIFLRSPTPLKNQRTSQACKKCRERKAKCSGTRPTCNRCSARGHACVYEDETLRAKRGAIDRRKHHKGSIGSSLRGNRHSDEATSSAVVSQDIEVSSLHDSTYSLSESFPDTSSESFPNTPSVGSWAEDEIDFNYAPVSDYPSTGEPFGSYHYVHAPQPLKQQCAPLLHEATTEELTYYTHPSMFAPSYLQPTSPMDVDLHQFQNGSYESQHYAESYFCRSVPQEQTCTHLIPSFSLGVAAVPHRNEPLFVPGGDRENSLGIALHSWVPV